MTLSPLAALAIFALLALVFIQRWRRRHGPRHLRRGPGPGAAGAVYELLNEERRKALEIIVEQRAEATDPEHADDKPEPGR